MLNCGVTVTNGSLKIRCNPAPISSRICVKGLVARVDLSQNRIWNAAGFVHLELARIRFLSPHGDDEDVAGAESVGRTRTGSILILGEGGCDWEQQE